MEFFLKINNKNTFFIGIIVRLKNQEEHLGVKFNDAHKANRNYRTKCRYMNKQTRKQIILYYIDVYLYRYSMSICTGRKKENLSNCHKMLAMLT